MYARQCLTACCQTARVLPEWQAQVKQSCFLPCTRLEQGTQYIIFKGVLDGHTVIANIDQTPQHTSERSPETALPVNASSAKSMSKSSNMSASIQSSYTSTSCSRSRDNLHSSLIT